MDGVQTLHDRLTRHLGRDAGYQRKIAALGVLHLLLKLFGSADSQVGLTCFVPFCLLPCCTVFFHSLWNLYYNSSSAQQGSETWLNLVLFESSSNVINVGASNWELLGSTGINWVLTWFYDFFIGIVTEYDIVWVINRHESVVMEIIGSFSRLATSPRAAAWTSAACSSSWLGRTSYGTLERTSRCGASPSASPTRFAAAAFLSARNRGSAVGDRECDGTESIIVDQVAEVQDKAAEILCEMFQPSGASVGALLERGLRLCDSHKFQRSEAGAKLLHLAAFWGGTQPEKPGKLTRYTRPEHPTISIYKSVIKERHL